MYAIFLSLKSFLPQYNNMYVCVYVCEIVIQMCGCVTKQQVVAKVVMSRIESAEGAYPGQFSG